MDIHIVMDNYATHKTAAVKAWLARRPHWHVHFTPTSASWINQVERWFAELTRKQLQRGVHRSTRQPEADILAFIDRHNKTPSPSGGPNQQTISSPPSNASAYASNKTYATNFRFGDLYPVDITLGARSLDWSPSRADRQRSGADYGFAG